MKTQAVPPPFKVFGRLHSWADPSFASCRYTNTDTHTELDYSVTRGEDVVMSGELEMEEVTDARSGSFQCWSPLFGHLHYHHLVPNRPKSPSNYFFPLFCSLYCRIRKVWQKRKCGVKFGCLTISHSTVRMCGPVLLPRHVNSNKSQRRSIYVSQNTRAFQINRPPAKLNLLTCQVRPNPEDKKTFDLVTSRFISNVWPMTLFPLHNITQVSSGVQMYVVLPTVHAFTPDWVNCSLELQRLHFTAVFFAPPQIIGHTISRQRTSRNAWCKCWNRCSHHSLPYLLLSCCFYACCYTSFPYILVLKGIKGNLPTQWQQCYCCEERLRMSSRRPLWPAGVGWNFF